MVQPNHIINPEIDTFHESIVLVKSKALRLNIASELRKHGAETIISTDEPKEALGGLEQFPNGILVLDYEFGFDVVTRILDKAKVQYKADSRPMYLICKNLQKEVVALATDYNVMRLRAGDISGDDIHKDIHDIYVYEHLSESHRMMLHEVSELRVGAMGKGRGQTEQVSRG